MARISPPLVYSPKEIRALSRLIKQGERTGASTASINLAKRCQIVLACIGKHRTDQVAQDLHCNTLTVHKWRERYRQHGIKGLDDAPRSGRRHRYTDEQLDKLIVPLLKQEPPLERKRWSGTLLAQSSGVPAHTIWRFCRKRQIKIAAFPRRSKTKGIGKGSRKTRSS